MPSMVATGTGFPRHYYSQDQLIAEFRELWSRRHFNLDRIEQFHRNVLVGGRHLAMPAGEYARQPGFGSRNQTWLSVGLDLGEQVVTDVLERGGVDASQVGSLFFTTVTGLAVPSLEARLMNRVAFPSHLKRYPLFGLGCLAGAAGIARVADYLRGHPTEAALLLSVELCSLTVQLTDLSVANIVSSGLFGDGAAAVLMVGEEHPQAGHGSPRVVDSRSVFFPDSEEVMGWEITDEGFRVVLSPDVPDYARDRIAPAAVEFLGEHELTLKDVEHWIAHPGGPRVIEALEQALGLGEGALDLSRKSLAEVGNVSSASVLFVLDEFLNTRQPLSGSYGVILAMGPAFCAEIVLVQW